MDLGLKNKVALVAAASQGLGKASAYVLAEEGANVVICSRGKKEIQKAAREIEEKTGAQVVPVVADLTKPRNIKKLVDAAKKKFGSVHILVNNCGGPPMGDILTLTDDDWHAGVELTLMSAVRLTRAVLPLMVKQEWGRVVTIVSIVAKQPVNELLLSSTLRPGILGLSKVLSNLYAKHNITVNTVCPGFILTRRQEELMQSRSATSKVGMEEYVAEIARQVPVGRLGKPEEIGNVIAFLASAQASYINGVNLLVDGGMARGIN